MIQRVVPTLSENTVVSSGLDYRPWVRVTSRLQAHLAACAQPLAAAEVGLAGKIKEVSILVGHLTDNSTDFTNKHLVYVNVIYV